MNNQDKSNSQLFLNQNDILKELFDRNLHEYEFLFENKDTVSFNTNDLLKVMNIFQSNSTIKFETLIDITAVDYSDYGVSEWNEKNANNKGYSRGINKDSSGR